MPNARVAFLAIAIISGILGFSIAHPIIDGLGKALFGVFMCLFFIALFFGKAK